MLKSSWGSGDVVGFAAWVVTDAGGIVITSRTCTKRAQHGFIGECALSHIRGPYAIMGAFLY